MASAPWEHCYNLKRLPPPKRLSASAELLVNSAAVQGFVFLMMWKFKLKVCIHAAGILQDLFILFYFLILNFPEFYLPPSDADYIHF